MIVWEGISCFRGISKFYHCSCHFYFSSFRDFLNFEERSIRVGEFKRVEIMDGWVLKVVSVSNGDYKS